MDKKNIITAVTVVVVAAIAYAIWGMFRGPKYVGCFVDRNAPNRALPTLSGAPMSVSECAKAAKQAGYDVFGLQYGSAKLGTGQCWVGGDYSSATQYGEAPKGACAPISGNPEDYMGITGLVNAVYAM